jgi:hypothetical protein
MGLAGGHKDITHYLGANKKLTLHEIFQSRIRVEKRPNDHASWISRLKVHSRTNRSLKLL